MMNVVFEIFLVDGVVRGGLRDPREISHVRERIAKAKLQVQDGEYE